MVEHEHGTKTRRARLAVQLPAGRRRVAIRDVFGVTAALAWLSLGAAGCVLVMDADFDKYEAASTNAPVPDASTGDAGGAPADASPDVMPEAAGGMAGTGGAGAGGGGVGGSGGTTPDPTCFDGISNQGEEGVDCGGPCPPCPTQGFSHTENFDMFPNWGPDGPYTVGGTCAQDLIVDGWGVSNEQDSLFKRASGYYAAIVTDDLAYFGVFCDDALFSPDLDTREATQVTVQFDSSLLTFENTRASVGIVRDGTPEEIWSRSIDGVNRHEVLGPVPTNGAAKVSVYFRYEAMYEFYWKVDNVRIDGT